MPSWNERVPFFFFKFLSYFKCHDIPLALMTIQIAWLLIAELFLRQQETFGNNLNVLPRWSFKRKGLIVPNWK